MKVLIIAAHPDDETLGMGGTILKHTNENDVVDVIFLCTGITSRRKAGYKNSSSYKTTKNDEKLMKHEINSLRKDAQQVCKILNVNNVKFFDFPDNELDSIPLLQIIKVIEGEISKVKPERIYTNHFGDLNVDHRITYQAVITACRPFSNNVKELMCFEVPSSTEWNYPSSFNPNLFVNIDKFIGGKIEAIELYKNELREYPHPRSKKALEIIASRWGTVSDCNYAEAFEIIRKIEC